MVERMRGSFRYSAHLFALLLIACAGSTPPPAEPEPEAEPPASDTAQTAKPSSAEQDKADIDQKPIEEGKSDKSEKPGAAAEPQFTENMSVEEAIKAVPRESERLNMDQETLGKPLQET